MQEVAITYGILAWLVCWLIDLVVMVARGPLFIDPILKLIVVALCAGVLIYRLSRHGWLLGN